jgi:GH3 auxin-responsive promoter
LANVLHLDDCIYLTLRFLLQARSLTFISVWNPSFLQILLRHLELNGEQLVTDLGAGSATVSTRLPPPVSRALRRDASQSQKLQSMLRQGRIEPTVLWPKLRLISCWTSASSAFLKAEIEQKFPGVGIQGKGLLATEGVISIPIERYGGCVAAMTSHFLEFMDPQSGLCRSLSEVEKGAEYSVILTTGGGLWRYRLGDRVRVTGFAECTPILEFIGKQDCVSDLRGEKLNAIFVERALDEIECCRNAVFAMLAPSHGAAGYTLFLESRHCSSGLAALLDMRLRENPHYDYARNLAQLAPVRVFRIAQSGREDYILRCELLGQRAGSVKTTALDKRTGWEEVFRGNYVGVEPVEVSA